MPRVVHCKRETFDVYIGRPSKWGNPFKLYNGGDRDAVIAQYERWCAPKSCHGDVLVRLANTPRLADGDGEGGV